MVENIEKVLERGEKIELLVDKTDNLRFQVRAPACGHLVQAAQQAVDLLTHVLNDGLYC